MNIRLKALIKPKNNSDLLIYIYIYNLLKRTTNQITLLHMFRCMYSHASHQTVAFRFKNFQILFLSFYQVLRHYAYTGGIIHIVNANCVESSS